MFVVSTLFIFLIFFSIDTHLVKDLAQYATNKGFTHLIILSEKAKICNG